VVTVNDAVMKDFMMVAVLFVCIYAVYFDDADMAAKILNEHDPRHQKSLARNVKNFDEAEWNKVSQSVVKQGSLEKVCRMSTMYCVQIIQCLTDLSESAMK